MTERIHLTIDQLQELADLFKYERETRPTLQDPVVDLASLTDALHDVRLYIAGIENARDALQAKLDQSRTEAQWSELFDAAERVSKLLDGALGEELLDDPIQLYDLHRANDDVKLALRDVD
jgi:hypothetical protein